MRGRLRVWTVGIAITMVWPAAGAVGVVGGEGMPGGEVESRAGQLAGSEFRISGPVATTHEVYPVVAYNSTDDEFLVVWQDTRNTATRGADVFGQRVGRFGFRKGSNFRISAPPATADELEPAVAYNALDNQFLVVWQDDRDDATRGIDVYGQRIAADGSRVGAEFRISGPAATFDERHPDVAFNSLAGDYLVVWQDDRNDATRGIDVYGQRVTADGGRTGANFRISGGAATRDDIFPAVAANETANQYLVAWTDYRDGQTRGTDIYAQRIAWSGARIGSNFRISGAAAIRADSEADVAWNSTTNQYMIVWEDARNQSTRDWDIYGQRVSTTGARTGGNFRISGSTATQAELIPAVSHNSTSNQYLVTWRDYRNDPTRGWDIYGQRVTATGARTGGNFRISGPDATADEVQPAVSHSPSNNQYLVVWHDARTSAPPRGNDVYGQRVIG